MGPPEVDIRPALGVGRSHVDDLVLGLVGVLGLIERLRFIGDLDELADLGHISVLGDPDNLGLVGALMIFAVPGEHLQLVRDPLAGDRQGFGDVLELGPQLPGSEQGFGLHGVEVGAELGERLQGDKRERFDVLQLAKQGASVGHMGGSIRVAGASHKGCW